MKKKIRVLLLFIVVCVFALWPKRQNEPLLPVEEGETGIVLMGDSTIGNCKNETGIAALLEKETQKPTYNCAIGGTCMASINTSYKNDYYYDDFSVVHLCETVANQDFRTLRLSAEYLPLKKADLQAVILLLENVDFKKTEYIFLAQGLNDYLAQVSPTSKEEGNIYSYEGALTEAVKDLQSINPEMHIVILSPTYNLYIEEPEVRERVENYSFFEYISICEEVAKKCNVEYINMYEMLNINKNNEEKYLFDRLHFNEEGRKLYASILVDYIKNQE